MVGMPSGELQCRPDKKRPWPPRFLNRTGPVFPSTGSGNPPMFAVDVAVQLPINRHRQSPFCNTIRVLRKQPPFPDSHTMPSDTTSGTRPDAPAETPVTAIGSPELRLWPAWLIAVMQIAALILTVTPSIQNLTRFLFMMAGPLVAGLLFSAWLLLASRLRWKEKLALAAAGVACPAVASQISVPEEALRTTMWIYGVPLAIVFVTLALTVWQANTRRCAIAILLLCFGWGSFAFLRNEGFDGDYYAELRWRWSPRHEDTLPELRPESAPSTASLFESARDTASWTQFRGPGGNGGSDEDIAPLDWTRQPPKELWRIPIGPGWGSFAFHQGRLFTQEQRGDKEHLSCYAAADGRLIWTHSDETRFSEVVSGAGPRSTPNVSDGLVYALGGRGLLTCVREQDGELVWQRDLVADFQAPIPMWGFSGSPLIHNRRLIIFAGGPADHGLISLDATTGQRLWGFASTDMNYTTARPMTFDGGECLVFCDSRGVHGIEPETGERLWTFMPSLWKGPAMVDPQQISATGLIVGLGDGIGMARLDVVRADDQWTVTEVWKSTKLRPSFNDSVVLNDCVFGFNQAVFSCIDLTTGERKWQGGRYGFGQALLIRKAGQIVVAAENGDAVLLQATPDKLTEMARVPVLNDKTWNHPIMAGNRLFLRNGKSAVCLQL